MACCTGRQIRSPYERGWLSGMNRNLQCLSTDLFDEPFFQPDEFGRGPLGDLEPDEGGPRQTLLTV
jgi:hypothetical protein